MDKAPSNCNVKAHLRQFSAEDKRKWMVRSIFLRCFDWNLIIKYLLGNSESSILN